MFVDSEPPPAERDAVASPPTATETATASDVTEIASSSVAFDRDVAAVRVHARRPRAGTRARRCRSCCARARARSRRRARVSPARLAATAPAAASAVMCEVSEAVTESAAARGLEARRLRRRTRRPSSRSCCPSRGRRPRRLRGVLAGEGDRDGGGERPARRSSSCRSAAIVMPVVGVDRRAVRVRLDLERRSTLAPIGPPPHSVQPIKLRASEKPIAIVGRRRRRCRRPRAATASTVAVIAEVSEVVIETAPWPAPVPVAVSELASRVGVRLAA